MPTLPLEGKIFCAEEVSATRQQEMKSNIPIVVKYFIFFLNFKVGSLVNGCKIESAEMCFKTYINNWLKEINK